MKAGLALATHGPQRVPQVVVDHRVNRLKLGCAFHVNNRLFVASKPVKDPSEAVDDIAAVRAGRDRLFDHLQGFVQIDLLFDHRIAQIVQHLRLTGVQRQRVTEIRLGLFPLAQTFVRDGAGIQQEPFGPRPLCRQLKRTVIGSDGLGELVLLAQHVAQCGKDHRQIGIAARQLLQHFDRRIRLVRAAQGRGAPQFGGVKGRITGGHFLVDGDGQIVLVQFFQKLGIQQQRVHMIGAQVAGQPTIKQRIVRRCLAAQRTGQRIEHFRQPVAGRGDMGKRQGFPRLKGRDHPLKLGVQTAAKGLLQAGHRIGVAIQLAQHFGARHGSTPGADHGAAVGARKNRFSGLIFTAHRQRHRLVIERKAFQTLLARNLVKARKPRLQIARAHIGPSCQQPVDQRPDALSVHVTVQQRVIILALRHVGNDRHVRRLTAQARFFHLQGNRQCLQHVAQQQMRQRRVLHQGRIFHVMQQRHVVIACRRAKIVQIRSLPRRQIGARNILCRQRRCQRPDQGCGCGAFQNGSDHATASSDFVWNKAIRSARGRNGPARGVVNKAVSYGG